MALILNKHADDTSAGIWDFEDQEEDLYDVDDLPQDYATMLAQWTSRELVDEFAANAKATGVDEDSVKELLEPLYDRPVETPEDALISFGTFFVRGFKRLRHTLACGFAGSMSLEEWAQSAATVIDEVKEQLLSSQPLRYVGGELHFESSPKDRDMTIMSFELYFLDRCNQWQKAGAESSILNANLTAEALKEIADQGRVTYEID